MGAQQAPPPPESWAAQREKNRAGRSAAPSEQPEETNYVLPEQTYKVVGPREVFGTAPGDSVRLALSEGQELSLIEAGHLALVADKEANDKVDLEKDVEKTASDADPGSTPVVKED